VLSFLDQVMDGRLGALSGDRILGWVIRWSRGSCIDASQAWFVSLRSLRLLGGLALSDRACLGWCLAHL